LTLSYETPKTDPKPILNEKSVQDFEK